MRARRVNEDINFERGGNTKSKIGVGRAKEAEEKLDEMLNKYGSIYKFPLYKIDVNSLDDIRVRYSDKFIEMSKNDNIKIFEWRIKYHPIPQFFKEDYQKESQVFNQIHRENKWAIQKNVQGSRDNPGDLKVLKQWVLSIDKENPNAEEYADTIVEAFNSKYGELWVFETIGKERYEG